MEAKRYDNLEQFRTDVLPVLLEEEVYNNLLISIVSGTVSPRETAWYMGTVAEPSGKILLTALCTKPYNMMLSIARGVSGVLSDDAMRLLSTKLRESGFTPPGVFAVSDIAARFTQIHTGKPQGTSRRGMVLMRLDKLIPFKPAPGFCRLLNDADLSYVPAWEQAFNADCSLPPVSFAENEARIRTRLGRDLHYIWIDVAPVSQAVFGRETPNGGVVTWVYTPPEFRGRGYATSVVGELTLSLLARGKKFCCLFADAGNPISRGIYSKLGYYDVAEFQEIGF